MPDEEKPVQKSPPETPKDIEDLLKDLPKISNPSAPPPSAPKPQTTPPPLSPPPPKPSLPVSPLPPKPTPLTSQPQSPSQAPSPVPQTDKFKSLIRTMGDDLESAQKGIKPESKTFEIKQPPAPPAGGPKPLTAPPFKPPLPSEVKLGPAERTKALDLPKPKAPFTEISKPKKPSPIFKITMLVLGIGVISAGAWYFISNWQGSLTIIPTATPEPTPTPVPTPKILSELIPFSSQITISTTENFKTGLDNGIKSAILNRGGWTALNIADENGIKYSLDQIFQRLDIAPPSGILDNLDPNDWLIALYGQQEMFDSKGVLSFNQNPAPKLGLIAKTSYPSTLRSSLNTWETTMSDDLVKLFGFDSKKSFTQTLVDNIYNGTGIRYKNFLYADNSIDYAIFNLLSFNSDYFIITNSRESIYSAINLLQTQ